jgi:hypothetical protein
MRQLFSQFEREKPSSDDKENLEIYKQYHGKMEWGICPIWKVARNYATEIRQRKGL